MKNTWRFDERELKYIREVLDSGFASSTEGDMNMRLEKAFAEKIGAKFAITMNSGTSTMHACLAAAGVGPGDEVIVPAITVISTANVVLHQNAVPIFADIDTETFNIDVEDIKRKISQNTKAIIPVSLYGLPVDFDPIMKLAEEHDLIIIEDDAQAHLAEYKGRKIGTIGHMASFSFENSKHMTTGDGGIVTTNNEEYAMRVRKFASQGYAFMKPEDGRVKRNVKDVFQNPEYKRHDSFGWNYRMPEVAAAVGLAQLEKLDHFVDSRVKIANMYFKIASKSDLLIPQRVPEGYTNTYFTFAATFEGEVKGISWHDFRQKYIEFGGDGIYASWAVVYLEDVFRNYRFYGKGCPHQCPHYSGKVEYKEGLCPNAERVQKKLMQFVNNYSCVEEAMPKVEALEKTIAHFSG